MGYWPWVCCSVISLVCRPQMLFLVSTFLFCGLVVSFRPQTQRYRVWFPALTQFLRISRSGTGSTQPHEDNWGATWMNSSGCSLKKPRSTASRTCCADHATHQQNFAQKFAEELRPLWCNVKQSVAKYRYTLELFPRSWSGRGVKLSPHFQLVSSSRKCGSIHPLRNTPSWRNA
jgi:hypothetical protein